jgi:anti-sigma B factor antagonist
MSGPRERKTVAARTASYRFGFAARARGYRDSVNSVHARRGNREPALLGPLADDTVVIWLGPESDLVRRIGDSVQQGTRHVVVDVGDVEMLDSSTLSALKRVAGRLRTRGGRLSVICSQPRLASHLHLTQLSRSFHVFETLDEALHTAP